MSGAGWLAVWRSRRWLWRPAVLFAVTRLGIALVAYLGATLLAPPPDIDPYHILPNNRLLDVFGSRWDTGFYLSIATEGYRYQGVTLPSVAFFPLLPLLMRALAPLTGGPLLAGILISNGALLLASILFYRLVAREWGEATAERAVWYLLIFPTSFFGSAIYTESLFLLTGIGALYAARRRRWAIAAACGAAAGLTRLVGLIVAPMLLLEWWLQRRPFAAGDGAPAAGRPGVTAVLAPLAVPLGTLSYMAFLWFRFDDPLAFVRASAAWARQPQSPALTIGQLFTPPAEGWWPALLAGRLPLNDWSDLAFVLLFLGLGFVLLYQHRWSEGLFVWLGVMLAFSSGLLMSQRRYMWVLFPVFILLARWGERPLLDRLITMLSLAGLALFTALFAGWYWVG